MTLFKKLSTLQRKANEPLLKQSDKASRELVDLFPKGFDGSQLSLSKLLAYLYKHKGLEATNEMLFRDII